MNFRVHFGFYVDVQNVADETEARHAAVNVFVAGDLVDQFKQQPSYAQVRSIRQHILDRARAWLQRVEPKP